MFHKCSGSIASYPVYYYYIAGHEYLWYNNPTYYISTNVGIGIKVDNGTTIYPNLFPYDSYPVYANPKTGYLFLWRNGNQWVINNVLGYGCRETDNGATVSPRWTGDAWYGKNATGGTAAGTYVARGTLKNTSPSNVVVTDQAIVGYSSNTKTGTYTQIGGATTRIVGLRQLTEGGRNYVAQESQYNTYDYFKDMVTENGLYIWRAESTSDFYITPTLGSFDPLVGYWHNTTETGTYTRVYTGEPDDPAPGNKTVTDTSYVEGTRTASFYIAQVGLWLS